MDSRGQWEEYCCEYRHDGQAWCLNVKATSFEDAARRLRAVGANGEVLGSLKFKLPLTTQSPLPLIAVFLLGAVVGVILA